MSIVINKLNDRSFSIHFVEESDRQAFLECLARGLNTWQRQTDAEGAGVREAAYELSR